MGRRVVVLRLSYLTAPYLYIVMSVGPGLCWHVKSVGWSMDSDKILIVRNILSYINIKISVDTIIMVTDWEYN